MSDAADRALDALRRDAPGRPAVTTLSVDEAILLDQIGLEPVGTVTGASVVQLGTLARLGVGMSTNAELVDVSQALGSSRITAIDRLTAAGRGLGADGVVGVALEVGDLGRGENLVHLTATGTAVRLGGNRPGRSGPTFTAALSGHEVQLLDRAGYSPLGIVSGVCAYHVGRRAMSEWAGSIKDNVEMTVYTEALYDARELAMTRLQDGALRLDADGVIGVAVTERTGVWGSHVIEFAAIGTAIRRRPGEHPPLDPQLVIDLAG